MPSKYDSPEFIGRRYNKLTVVGMDGPGDGKSIFYWRVLCTCGNVHRARAQHVVDSKVIGCCRCKSNKPGITQTFLTKFKFSAVSRGLEFCITLDDIHRLYDTQGGRCALSGDTLTLPVFAGRQDGHFNISIDRVDPSRGYTPDNIQLVTKQINLAKGPMTDGEFINMCRRVSRCRKTVLN